MPTYTLDLELLGTYLTDMPGFQIWANGSQLGSTYLISSSGSSISTSFTYGGALPSSLEFRFDDASGETPRTIEIQSVKINDRYVNTGNYLSSNSLVNGGNSTVDIAGGADIFDQNYEPPSSEFTIGATKTFTASFDFYRKISGATDEVFDMLAGNDYAHTAAGDDKISGGAGNDFIRAGAGNDLLFGGADDDRLLGQDGNDEIYGGTGNDRLFGNDGDDELHGGAGNDKVNGHVGDDLMTGGDGNDLLNGGSGADIIYGDDGVDTLVGAAGADTLDGGAGNDVIYGGAGADQINGGDDDDILIGNGDDDIISGDAGNDQIVGGLGNDTLRGGIGNDVISGGDGDDDVNGGTGNDTIYGDANGVNLLKNGGFEDTSDGVGSGTTPPEWIRTGGGGGVYNFPANRGSEGSYSYPIGGWTSAVGGDISQIITTQIGETYTLTFDAGVNFGTSGTLSVQVLNGAVPIVTDSIVDTDVDAGLNSYSYNFTAVSTSTTIFFELTASTGDADFDLDNVAVFLTDIGDDVIDGDDGDDIIYAEAGNDVIFGGDGNDTLDGGAGIDTIEGGAGDDIIRGGTGNDVIYANADTGIYDADWSFKRSITIDSAMVDSDMTDFTVLITGAGLDANFWSNVKADGSDILFTLADGVTVLDREVVDIDTVAETLEVHVRVPNLSSTLDTELKLHYGNAGVTLTNDATTFGENYTGVWHLDDDLGGTVIEDSSRSQLDGTARGGLTSADIVTAQVGDGLQFNNAEYIALNHSYVGAVVAEVSVSGWVNTTYSAGGGIAGNWAILDFDRSEFFNVFLDSSTGQLSFSTNASGIHDFTAGSSINDGSWHHVAAVYDGTDKILYVDGVEIGRDVNTHGGSALGNASTRFGFIGDGSEASTFDGARNNAYYDGQFDDIRLYEGTLTADEIAAQFDNQDDPSSFYSVGAVETTLITETDDVDTLYGGDGDDILYASSGGDTLHGGDGFDTLYGSSGLDTFVLEAASAYNDVDEIFSFRFSEGDILDVSDLIVGAFSGTITDYVQLVDSGTDTLIQIDSDGLTGGSSFVTAGQFNNITGLDEVTLFTDGNIVV